MDTLNATAEFWAKASAHSDYVQKLFRDAMHDIQTIEQDDVTDLTRDLCTDLRASLDDILIPLAYAHACMGKIQELPATIRKSSNMRHQVLGRMQAILTPMALVESPALHELSALVEMWKAES